MSLPKYPHYKPSGVEWLGDVPAHWSMARVKSLTVRISSGKTPLGGSETYVDAGVLFLRSQNVHDEGLRLDDAVYITPETDGFMASSRVKCGDVLLNITGASIGRSCIVPPDCPPANVNQHVCVIRLCDTDLANYIAWVFKSDVIKNQIDLVQNGAAREGLNFEQIGAMLVPIALGDEQSAIAHFLDHETAKIDALIAEQAKLIALLAEKRQATISHAVTRGLDPAAPMKDSGVAWLGEVPAHWGVCSLRRVIAAIEQGWSPECYAREAEAGEWGVLKAGCLNGGIFRATENKALPPELTPDTTYEVRVGDVLMSRASGSPELVGSTALVKETRPRLMLSDKIFRLRLQDVMTSRYFVTAMNSRALRTQIENALSGGNGMANNLPQSNLLAFSLPVPTMAEQEEISDFVETETACLDALRAEAERAIALLKERRAALIAAAVTGQIDVRGWRVN